MTSYTIVRERNNGICSADEYAFQDDQAAILFAMPETREASIQIWREDRLITCLDERRA
jgi:hypothetical protein